MPVAVLQAHSFSSTSVRLRCAPSPPTRTTSSMAARCVSDPRRQVEDANAIGLELARELEGALEQLVLLRT